MAAKRTMAARIHPPLMIFARLFFLALVCSLVAGYSLASGRRRRWMHTVAFAAVTAIAVYVIIEIEYHGAGLIPMGTNDEVLVDFRASMR